MMHLLFLLSFIVSISSQSYLSLHNSARRQAGVYNNLRRSYTLESSARKVASWLCRTGQFKHSTTSGYGDGTRPRGLAESIAGHGTIDAGVNAFIAERQYYSNGRCRSGKVCGHYEIIINSGYTEVGCANVRGCSGSMKLGRVACHYKRGGRLEIDRENTDCDGDYDGDMCLSANGKEMRFALEQKNGCEFEDKTYKHTDAASNSYYLHYHPMEEIDNTTELEDRWLVSRDYVSDIALFWCDSASLMECAEGRWSKNIFEELGVREEIDNGITIRQCPRDDAMKEEAAVDPMVLIVLIALAVLIIAGAIYFVFRMRNKGPKKVKHLELKDEEIEVNQTETIEVN